MEIAVLIFLLIDSNGCHYVYPTLLWANSVLTHAFQPSYRPLYICSLVPLTSPSFHRDLFKIQILIHYDPIIYFLFFPFSLCFLTEKWRYRSLLYFGCCQMTQGPLLPFIVSLIDVSAPDESRLFPINTPTFPKIKLRVENSSSSRSLKYSWRNLIGLSASLVFLKTCDPDTRWSCSLSSHGHTKWTPPVGYVILQNTTRSSSVPDRC